MRATLFGVPASHPSLAAELMLQHKGLDYRRIDLVTAAHRGLLRALGFPRNTVPAMRLGGAKVQGSKEIALALDAVAPDPPLFPADPEGRAAVEEAEAWGNEVLQPVPRRLVWNALKHDRSGIASYLEGAKLGIPVRIAALTAPPIAAMSRRFNNATDENARRDLAAVPGLIDRVDELIDAGRHRRGGAERRRLPDRDQREPPADHGRRAAADRGPPRRAPRSRRRSAPAGPHAQRLRGLTPVPSAPRRTLVSPPWKQPLHSGRHTSA